MKQKPKFVWDEVHATMAKSSMIAFFVGLTTGVINYVMCINELGWHSGYAELSPNFQMGSFFSCFFGCGIGAGLLTIGIGTLSYFFVTHPLRVIAYHWPIWATVHYWIYIRNPHTVAAAYYEIQEALDHLNSEDPEAAKLCLRRALTGTAPAYEAQLKGTA